MSILLEALRKSEKKHRSREVPTIHSEVPSSQPSETPRLLLQVLMLVVALTVSGWLVWQQYRPPEDGSAGYDGGDAGLSSQPVESSAEAVAAAQPTAGTSGARAAADTDASETPEADESSSAPPPLRKNAPGARPRTPMEDYRPPATASTAAQSTSTRAGGQNRQVAALRSASNALAANAAASGESGSADSPEPVERNREPAPITYWELPDAIRANVPEVKYTVLVYNRNPAERFVLINGERLAEGDSYLPGLVVKEIRRDGVIFSYRLYQFLVER